MLVIREPRRHSINTCCPESYITSYCHGQFCSMTGISQPIIVWSWQVPWANPIGRSELSFKERIDFDTLCTRISWGSKKGQNSSGTVYMKRCRWRDHMPSMSRVKAPNEWSWSTSEAPEHRGVQPGGRGQPSQEQESREAEGIWVRPWPFEAKSPCLSGLPAGLWTTMWERNKQPSTEAIASGSVCCRNLTLMHSKAGVVALREWGSVSRWERLWMRAWQPCLRKGAWILFWQGCFHDLICIFQNILTGMWGMEWNKMWGGSSGCSGTRCPWFVQRWRGQCVRKESDSGCGFFLFFF